MLRFLTTGGAEFSYDVDFSDAAYANLSFFAADRRDILFHLSLRHGKGLAVTNVKSDGDWLGETLHNVTFTEATNQHIDIRFEDGTLSVFLNGETVLDRSRDFIDLDRIEHVNWRGAIIDDSVSISGEANDRREGLGQIVLAAPFRLSGWAYDPASLAQRIDVEIEGLAEPPLVHVSAAPNRAAELRAATDHLALQACLPGRIWTAADPEGVVRIRARSNGVPCGAPLELTRATILETIENIATTTVPESDSFAALSTIEHVRFADLFGSLSPLARHYVITAARLYNVQDYLFLGELPEEAQAGTPPAGQEGGAEELLGHRIRTALQEALLENPDTGMAETLERLFGIFPLPAEARRDLVLSLVPAACQSDHPESVSGLNRLVADLDIPTEGTAFEISRALPLLMLRGEIGQIAGIVHALAEDDKAGVCIPAIGWALQNLAQREHNPWEDHHFDTVLRGLMAIVERLALSYWHLPCRTLVKGAVELLVHSDQVPDLTARRIEEMCLHRFALLRAFWEKLQAAESEGRFTMSPNLRAAAQAFGTLAGHDKAAPDDLESALRHLEALGALEAGRWRLELLGARAVASDPVRAIATSGQAPGELALRLLAAPGTVIENATVTAAARAALRERWQNVEKAPYYHMQYRTGQAVHRILDAVSDGAPDAEISDAIDRVAPQLRKISGQISGFLGISLMLVLIDQLVLRGAMTTADRLLAQVSNVLTRMPPAMRVKVIEAPNVRSALASLQHNADRTHAPTALAALALFPNRPDITALYPDAAPHRPEWANSSPLFNTLVCVFSCHPYLDTRIPQMRRGWLKDLEALGIPHVIIVGDGDDSLRGDVLHLDAPDDYEGLPQKTLAAVDWVCNNTTFNHMLKIDDDCFLNVAEYFHSLSYRKFHYYGRALTRRLGEMSRTWHHLKSSSQRARSELDKSPEPASYADGGGGYTLSRTAMRALLAARDSTEGWQLIANSYMEDKMVGDLLALRQITVASEDYYTTVARRTHGAARPVMMWDNYFLPSAACPSKMTHLDTAETQVSTRDALSFNQLHPRKLWPCFQRARLGLNSNQLELLSEEAHLDRLNKADLAVICTCRNEMARLPMYLAHYRRLGIKCFLFVDNVSDDGTREFLLEQKDCVVFSADTSYPAGRFGVTWQVTLMSNLRLGRWSLVADTDELLVFPGWEKGRLDRILATAAKAGADAFRINMVDMYPQGPLEEADLRAGDPFAIAGFTDRSPIRHVPLYRGPYSNDTTRVSAVRHRLIPASRSLTFLAQKYALLRYWPWMRLAEGLHYAAETRPAAQDLIFAHFKYDAGFAKRVRIEAARENHFNQAEEYRHYAGLMAGSGALSFHDSAVSVPWRKADIVQSVLSP